jgi:hypothetical protein
MIRSHKIIQYFVICASLLMTGGARAGCCDGLTGHTLGGDSPLNKVRPNQGLPTTNNGLSQPNSGPNFAPSNPIKDAIIDEIKEEDNWFAWHRIKVIQRLGEIAAHLLAKQPIEPSEEPEEELRNVKEHLQHYAELKIQLCNMTNTDQDCGRIHWKVIPNPNYEVNKGDGAATSEMGQPPYEPPPPSPRYIPQLPGCGPSSVGTACPQ